MSGSRGRRGGQFLRSPAALAFALAAIVAFSACGPSEEPADPGEPDSEATAVIENWATTLSDGDVAGAAELFATPSVAQNGVTVTIDDAADARLFNRSLPCGAELIGARAEGEFTVATFRLSERPGPGKCGAGTGLTAETAFLIEDGLIVEWRRVSEDPGPAAPSTAL